MFEASLQVNSPAQFYHGQGSKISHSNGSDWRSRLPELAGLPLLPCGAGDSYKAPIDPNTGGLLSDWQHSAFTSDELQMMSEKVICIGTRAGQDAGNLLIIDIDGKTALEACADRGASPADSGWIIRRNTADDRLKVAFRVPDEDLHRLKGDAADNLLGKAVLNTKSPSMSSMQSASELRERMEGSLS